MSARKRKAELLAHYAHVAMQDRGKAAFLAYYDDGPYARAKLDTGMVFTPELVAYLEREVQNRKTAEEIRKQNLESDDAESAAKPPVDGRELPGLGERNGGGGSSGVQEKR